MPQLARKEDRFTYGAYGRPEVQPLAGETAVTAIAGLSITWPPASPAVDGPV
jgi:hypothetical protein